MSTERDDKELLIAAAKAAGMEHMCWCGPAGLSRMLDPTRPDSTGSIGGYWNPLTSDADALRLAVKLSIYVGEGTAEVWRYGRQVAEIFEDGDDPYAATRRAITRAAAEIWNRSTATTSSGEMS